MTPMTPQEALEQAFALETEAGQLSSTISTLRDKRAIADAFARLTIAAEGIELLYTSILDHRPNLPEPEVWDRLLEAARNRTAAFREVITRGDYSVGMAANCFDLFSITEVPMREVVAVLSRAQSTAAKPELHTPMTLQEGGNVRIRLAGRPVKGCVAVVVGGRMKIDVIEEDGTRLFYQGSEVNIDYEREGDLEIRCVSVRNMTPWDGDSKEE